MPRIFLPAVTAKNNALLAGDTQVHSGDFEIQNSDDDTTCSDHDDAHDDSTTDDESPDLLHPACQKRAQQPEVAGRPAAASTSVATSGKRARIEGRGTATECHMGEERRAKEQSTITSCTGASTRSKDNQGKAGEPKENDTFAVVFMTVALGITLAAPASSDADGSLVVCDKDTTAMTSATSKVRVGDRLVALGGTSADGLSVDRVQRLIVRGSRPLEMTFRRRRLTSDDGGTAAKQRRPLGGLERPSRDCLLDTISNIATQEDSLLPDSQPQWPEQQQETQVGMVAGVSGRGRNENGGQGGDLSPPRNDMVRPSSPLSPPSPPLLPPLSPSRSSPTTGGGDGGGYLERQVPLASSPASSSSSSSTEADLLSPSAAGTETHAAIAAAAPTAYTPSPPPSRENARAAAAAPGSRPVVLQAPEVAGRPEGPVDAPRVAALAAPAPSAQTSALTLGDSGGVAGRAEEPDPKRQKSGKKKKKKKKKSGCGSASTMAASDAVPARQLVGKGHGLDTTTTTANTTNNGSSKAGLTGSSSSGGSGSGSGSGVGITGGGGGGGSEREAAVQPISSSAGAPALVPTAAEVTRILAKLGARGISELTLYKNLTFDELVRVCRYTGGVDLSKRLPKATMAERLNSLCVEQGALALELQSSRAAAGAGARAEKGRGVARRARTVQGAGHLNLEDLSTPVRPSAAPTPPPRRGAPPSGTFPEALSVHFAASPPPLQRTPSHARGGAQAPPRSPLPSPLVQTSHTVSMATPQQQQQQQQQLPLPPRSGNSSATSRHFRTAALPTSPVVLGDHGRGGAARAEDEDNWEDWDFLHNAGGRGRSEVLRRKRRGDEEGRGAAAAAGGTGGGDHGYGDGDGDEEAAWWSREPDHRDWSPCSSPTAAAAAAAPPSGSFLGSRFPPAERRNGEGEEGASRRWNPLLPQGLSSLSASAGRQQQQQQGETAQSLCSGLFSGGGLGFTALPRWILRSVRTIGTQTIS